MEKKTILSGFIVLLMLDMACALQATVFYNPMDASECTCSATCTYMQGGNTFLEQKVHCWYYASQITVPEDIKLVSSSNQVVGDELCVGDKFSFQSNVKDSNYDGDGGEYWEEGGYPDTPPVLWVQDIEEAVREVIDCQNKKGGGGYVSKFSNTMYSTNTPQQASTGSGLCGNINPTNYSYNYTIFPTNTGGYTTDTGGSVQSGGLPGVLSSCLEQMQGNCFATPEAAGGKCEGTTDKEQPYFKEKYKPMRGNVACAVLEKNVSAGAAVKNGNYYEVVGKEDINFTAEIDVQCFYYYDKSPFMLASIPSGTYPPSGLGIGFPIAFDCATGSEEMDEYSFLMLSYCNPSSKKNACDQLSADGFKVGTIRFNKYIKVVDSGLPKVDVTVVGADDVKFGQENILKVLVKNGGDVDITVTGISSKAPYRFISCDKAPVKPGEEAECLLSVTPKIGSGLDVVVSYGCKVCGKVKAGSVSKVLIESTTVTPAASAQIYSIDVHGDCENSYYGCYAPDKDGKFAVGYKCYNTGDQYYSPVKERFDLRFVLPNLSSKTVVGASLNLFASGVNRAQEVKVFSGKVDWTPTSCSASGDICSRPYCEQCAPSFDFAGGVQRSAQTIGGGGKVSYDLTDQVKEAYSGGLSVLNLQVRGEEDVWSSAGKDSCGRLNDWVKQDVEFAGSVGGKPYLEIVYK